jgi:hypothetical protein
MYTHTFMYAVMYVYLIYIYIYMKQIKYAAGSHIEYAAGPQLKKLNMPQDPTYIIRVTGNDAEKVVLSIFLQWDKEPADVSKVMHVYMHYICVCVCMLRLSHIILACIYI